MTILFNVRILCTYNPLLPKVVWRMWSQVTIMLQNLFYMHGVGACMCMCGEHFHLPQVRVQCLDSFTPLDLQLHSDTPICLHISHSLLSSPPPLPPLLLHSLLSSSTPSSPPPLPPLLLHSLLSSFTPSLIVQGKIDLLKKDSTLLYKLKTTSSTPRWEIN